MGHDSWYPLTKSTKGATCHATPALSTKRNRTRRSKTPSAGVFGGGHRRATDLETRESESRQVNASPLMGSKCHGTWRGSLGDRGLGRLQQKHVLCKQAAPLLKKMPEAHRKWVGCFLEGTTIERNSQNGANKYLSREGELERAPAKNPSHRWCPWGIFIGFVPQHPGGHALLGQQVL